MPSPSHIVPVMIGDPELYKAACDALLRSVPRGTVG
jgi:7-keto-8-aminopelargonate synthetase-like enzyme